MVCFCILGPLIFYYPSIIHVNKTSHLSISLFLFVSHLSISLFLSVSPHQTENVENICTLARIYDPAPTSCQDKNLSVRSGIEKCLTTDFPQMLARVSKILGKVNNSLFYKLQVRPTLLQTQYSPVEIQSKHSLVLTQSSPDLVQSRPSLVQTQSSPDLVNLL